MVRVQPHTIWTCKHLSLQSENSCCHSNNTARPFLTFSCGGLPIGITIQQQQHFKKTVSAISVHEPESETCKLMLKFISHSQTLKHSFDMQPLTLYWISGWSPPRNSRHWLTLSIYWPLHTASSDPWVVSHFFKACSISSLGVQDNDTFRLAESCKKGK